MKRDPVDPGLIRDRLAPAQGKRYWRGIEELADDPAVRAMVEREFPSGASMMADPLSRRRFLGLMGASIALAGAAGCRPPTGTILPYIRQPENMVLGKPLFYATTMSLAGWGVGLLVESHEGRPTKIEGNTLHPASLGGTSPLHQASILGLYDPERSQSVQYRARPRAYEDALAALRQRLAGDGAGFALLTEAVGSPTLQAQIDSFLKAHPKARWFQHEPVHRDNSAKGAKLAFGKAVHCFPRLEKADVVVSLGADFLAEGPSHLADARAFASRRRPGQGQMSRLYAVETNLTVTGANADHRLALKPSAIEGVARALAAKLGVPGAQGEDAAHGKWLDAVAADLKSRAPGKTLVLAGEGQPAVVHAIVHAINAHLKNLGQTVACIEPPLPVQAAASTLSALADALQAGDIDTLLVVGSNPAYTAPADLPIARLMEQALKTPARDRKSKKDWLAVHMGQGFDETARLCHWHIPQTHFLEEWSDAVAFDGTASVVQPLIAPLYQGKSAHELVGAITRTETGWDTRAPMDLVKAHWRTRHESGDFEAWWAKGLHDGVLAGVKGKDVAPAIAASLFDADQMKPVPASGKGYELCFAPEPGVFDGRFAGNGWLQEWPRPITRLTWDNALLVSPATAEALGVADRVGNGKGGEHGQAEAGMVAIEQGGRKLKAAVWVVPGHADGAATLHLGYGRTHAGKVGSGAGFDAYKLRLSTASWFLAGASIARTAGQHEMACVQYHASMEGRDLYRSGTLDEYKKDPGFATAHDLPAPGFEKGEGGRRKPLTLYSAGDHKYPGYRWGMAVDLSACTGCGACVVACQAENNSPVVGKEEVRRGREMHWLRIDRYFQSGKDDAPLPYGAAFQPVMCQHCEQAPCELVCPVEATVHGDEGTNDMVYNRCVGTRYCSNNCPYKVRRFNFFQYADFDTPQFKLMHNPDVTVRSQGVMEKCTFCIQRVSYARIEAAKEAMDELDLPAGKRKRRDANGPDGQPRLMDGAEVPLIRDGEVMSACQSACPSQAIVFGDLNDKKSKVRQMHDSALRYDLLGELGTRPHVAYLAAVKNPNPALEARTANGH